MTFISMLDFPAMIYEAGRDMPLRYVSQRASSARRSHSLPKDARRDIAAFDDDLSHSSAHRTAAVTHEECCASRSARRYEWRRILLQHSADGCYFSAKRHYTRVSSMPAYFIMLPSRGFTHTASFRRFAPRPNSSFTRTTLESTARDIDITLTREKPFLKSQRRHRKQPPKIPPLIGA